MTLSSQIDPYVTRTDGNHDRGEHRSTVDSLRLRIVKGCVVQTMRNLDKVIEEELIIPISEGKLFVS